MNSTVDLVFPMTSATDARRDDGYALFSALCT
jgi:hypothetical protein